MKVGGLSFDYGEIRPPMITLEDVISKFAELGFDGIELEFGTARLPAWDIKKAKKIKELCNSKGLEISNIAAKEFFITYGGNNLINKELHFVRSCYEMASAIDVPLVRTQIVAYTFGWLPKLEGRPYPSIDEQYSQGVSTLLKAVKFAEEFGVTLGLDNHFALTVMDHLRLVKEIGSPNLKIFIDTRNCVENGEDLLATVRACGKLLVHSHIKEGRKNVGGSARGVNKEELGDTVGVPVGMGNIIDWKAYLKALKEIGYKGFLSIEGAHVSPMYGPFECAQIGMKYLREINKEIGL